MQGCPYCVTFLYSGSCLTFSAMDTVHTGCLQLLEFPEIHWNFVNRPEKLSDGPTTLWVLCLCPTLYRQAGRSVACQWRNLSIPVCLGTAAYVHYPVQQFLISPQIPWYCPSSVSEAVHVVGVVCGVHCSLVSTWWRVQDGLSIVLQYLTRSTRRPVCIPLVV